MISRHPRTAGRFTPESRRRARQVAVQALFQDMFHAQSAWDWRAFVAARLRQFPDTVEFCQSLVLGARERRAELEAIIQIAMPNWNLSRLARIDRAILLIGALELLHSATPHKVAFDEAIEMARTFGGRESPSFVNGVLDRIWRNHSKTRPIEGSNA